MTAYLPIIAQIVFFLSVVLISFLLTTPLRRWARPAGGGEVNLRRAGRYLAGRIAFPLAVLILTRPFFLLAAAVSPVRFPPAYLPGWLAFWAALLFLNVLEALAIQICVLRGRSFPVPSLLRNIIRFLYLLLVLFAILRFGLKIDISPLLASTALLTAVIGFALQGVLSNLLGGMSLHLTRSMVPGDWIRVGEYEGRVIETNWRETRLRTLGGHTIVVPNSIVSSSVVHNLSTPTPVRRHQINVGASYSDAPGEVLAALVSAALQVPEVLRRPQPNAFVTEYKDFGINYVLRYWSKRYYDRTPIDGDVGRMIWYEFKRRGIEIPFPMSDKLLNDFMAVVYRQRKLPPDDGELERRGRVLAGSELWSKILVDGEGKPLLDREDAGKLASKLRFVRYTDGETLFKQGEAGENCYIVVKGKLKVSIAGEEGIPAVEIEIGPRGLVGEMSLLTGFPRTATVTAAGETELLEVNRGAFTRLLGLRPEIPEKLADLAAARAEKNAAALEQFQARRQEDLSSSLKRENILKRFLHFLHH
jgi:small-conductance mechanosensitive channel/CRP-like cAMP-binding protein